MLPKRKLLNPVELSVKPDKTPARPIPADMVIAIDISEYLGNFFLIKSIPKACYKSHYDGSYYRVSSY